MEIPRHRHRAAGGLDEQRPTTTRCGPAARRASATATRRPRPSATAAIRRTATSPHGFATASPSPMPRSSMPCGSNSSATTASSSGSTASKSSATISPPAASRHPRSRPPTSAARAKPRGMFSRSRPPRSSPAQTRSPSNSTSPRLTATTSDSTSGSSACGKRRSPSPTGRPRNSAATNRPPAIAGELADFDDDGLVTLLEYALRQRPAQRQHGRAPRTRHRASGRLALQFTRNALATDLTLTVQAADALAGPWTDLARSTNGNPFDAVTAGTTIIESTAGADPQRGSPRSLLLTNPAHPPAPCACRSRSRER